MLRILGIMSTGVVGLIANLALAGIPEPDVILYGPANVQGSPAGQGDHVVILARLASGREIGRFDFADCNADGLRDLCERSCQNSGCVGVPGCGTARDSSPADGLLDDCPGNLYALKVPCESIIDGLGPSGEAAVLDPSSPTVVRITMQIQGGAELFARDLKITERGKIRRVALAILDLLAFRTFENCHGGPSNQPAGGSCTPELFASADYDEDGDVDLHDYTVVQNHFVAE